MLSNYEVSLVNYDTQAPETLNDVFYSLKQLSSTIDNIYQKIETRFSTEKFRLDGIKLRIANCQNKINRIKGSKRATAVYSTAHFPAPKKPTLYASVLANATGGDPFRPADDSTHYIPADTKESAICNPKLNDDLTIMLTRLHSVQEKTAILYSEIKGLGSIPTTIESVSSLLVFNSSSNPYKDYLTVDNLDSAGRERVTTEDTGNGLASAPKSLMAGDILPDIAGLDLSFRPEMGAMVPLALPSNLPLDFLADNENYSAILPSIAPSVQLQPDFSLPQITAGDAYIAGPTAKEQQRASTTTIPGDSLPPPPPSSSTSAPPPPPPPPPASVPSNVPLIAPPVSTAISTEDFGVPPDAPAVEVDKPAAAPRNNLLAAIEDGGLKNLRKRNTDDDDQSNAPGLRKKTLAPKEDFMQDFKKKMMQRSKALTGEGDMETRKRDSLLVKQAVMKQSSPRIGGQDENDDGYIPRRINDDDDNDSNSAISGISNYDRNGRTVSRDSHITAASMPRAPPLLRPNPPPRPLPPVGAKGGLFDESNSKISNMINVGVKMDQDRADSHDDDDTNEDYWENS